MRTKHMAALIAAGVLAAGGAVASDTSMDKAAGHLLVRARVLNVSPDESGNVLVASDDSDSGFDAVVKEDYIPELDFTYFFTDHFGAELILGTSQHDVYVDNGSTVVDAGSVRLLPPTLTAQWHFNPKGKISPYVGAGINYTVFYDVDNGALADVKYDNAFGWALQAGVDVALQGNWSFNVDVKKLFLETDMTADATGVGLAPVKSSVTLDPWIVGVGVGKMF